MSDEKVITLEALEAFHQQAIELDAAIAYRRFLPEGMMVEVHRMLFNHRVVFGMAGSETYQRGFCFHTALEAIHAAEHWDGVGDPPGNWIKEVGTDRYGPGSMAWEREA